MNISKSAKAAAKWWTNVLDNPKFDNGGRDESNIMASMMAKILSNESEITDEQKIIFENILIEYIIDQHKRFKMVTLRVDYTPDDTLSEAAKVANISLFKFPWKTYMKLSEDGSIVVSYGYRSPEQIVPVEDTFKCTHRDDKGNSVFKYIKSGVACKYCGAVFEDLKI